MLLKVTIKDFKNPVEYIKFIEYRTHKDSTTYKNAVDDIQKSLSVLNIIINENDKS